MSSVILLPSQEPKHHPVQEYIIDIPAQVQSDLEKDAARLWGRGRGLGVGLMIFHGISHSALLGFRMD